MADAAILNVFFREKPVKMLTELLNDKGERYASSLAKSVDCTYSHVVKILQDMQTAGLITFKKTGRLKLLALTPKGRAVAEHMEKIRQTLSS